MYQSFPKAKNLPAGLKHSILGGFKNLVFNACLCDVFFSSPLAGEGLAKQEDEGLQLTAKLKVEIKTTENGNPSPGTSSRPLPQGARGKNSRLQNIGKSN